MTTPGIAASTQPDLAQRFAALQAERERTWPAEQLERNAAQRRELVARARPGVHPAPGTRLAPFELVDAQGKTLAAEQIVGKGPAVLVFFRFGGCPACNIALPYYNDTLEPVLTAAGIPLLAVSAQIPVDQGPTQRHGLRYPTFSDPGYALSRQLGLTFLPLEQPAVAPGEPWIGATLGTQSYEMVQPAVLIVESDLTVRLLDVSPDWLVRPEASAILAHLPEANAAAEKAA